MEELSRRSISGTISLVNSTWRAGIAQDSARPINTVQQVTTARTRWPPPRGHPMGESLAESANGSWQNEKTNSHPLSECRRGWLAGIRDAEPRSSLAPPPTDMLFVLTYPLPGNSRILHLRPPSNVSNYFTPYRSLRGHLPAFKFLYHVVASALYFSLFSLVVLDRLRFIKKRPSD